MTNRKTNISQLFCFFGNHKRYDAPAHFLQGVHHAVADGLKDVAAVRDDISRHGPLVEDEGVQLAMLVHWRTMLVGVVSLAQSMDQRPS